jgi:ELWxxDGT repeat protein
VLRLEVLEARLVPSLSPFMLQDINQAPSSATPFNGFPEEPPEQDSQWITINGTLFFTAVDGVHGRELWRSDGTAQGTALVKAITPTVAGSGLDGLWLTNVSGTLFFVGGDGTHGFELWKSDGTALGTGMVTDIDRGPASSSPTSLTNVNGTLFFAATDAVHGRELWRSDGTAAGTTLVKDIHAGTGDSMGTSPSLYAANVNGTLFFEADDGVHGRQLWRSDGTAAGTRLTSHISQGQFNSIVYDLTNVNSTLFFSGSDGNGNDALYRSDGTLAGTFPVRSINNPPHFSVGDLENVNGILFFEGNTPTTGAELWRSDGTQLGTHVIKDINPGSANGLPPGAGVLQVPNVNGVVFFPANNGVSGFQLWKSNGTASGTVLVKIIDPHGSSGYSYPYPLVNVNGTVFFQDTDGTHGRELWRTDGTAAGTVMIKDNNRGSASSYPSYMTNLNGTLFFSADDGTHGFEFWKSNGTAAGTTMVRDIFPGTNGSSYPQSFTNVNGTAFFTATNGPAPFVYSRTSVWQSNGMANGTVTVPFQGNGYGLRTPSNLTNVNGTLFVTANDPSLPKAQVLWRTDGTAAGTSVVEDNSGTYTTDPPEFLNFSNVNGTLFFATSDRSSEKLWESNGTASGTVVLWQANVNTGYYASQLTNVNGTLFFSANDGTHGQELWESNGTAAGTFLVQDINPGSTGSYPSQLINVNGALFFSASDGVHGQELWESNGTSAGTFMVKDINAGSAGSYPSQLLNVRGTLFFTASDPTHGLELWKSNGIFAGTTLVKDIQPGPLSSSISGLTNVSGTLFFAANEGVHGKELWESNGTAAGTILVADINVGTKWSSPAYLTNVNGSLFFSADDGIHGTELWQSNGTAAGTALLMDIRPGLPGSYPPQLTNINGTLFFAAFDGVHGMEPWTLGPVPTSPQAALDTYVAVPDPSYHYSLNSTLTGTGYTDYVIDMTSQTWRSPAEVDRTAWQHWLQVIVPTAVKSSTAVLEIGGGSNSATPPTTPDGIGVQTATTLGAITVVLPTVPNEPLTFAGETSPRTEDQIVAYTLNQYLNGGDSNWPLLLPMVKSAVRAMDTTQTFVASQSSGALHVDNFIVTGASKRGWTTWLTPAVDSRVRAIVPYVFDALNLNAQIPHENDTYAGVTQDVVGGFSSALQDYTNFNIFGRFNTPQGQALGQIVDPYAYLGRPTYNIPKYLIDSSGDQFFAPDSSQFYFQNLPGQNYIRYVPNTDHSLNGDAVAGGIGFEKAIIDGAALPRFTWNLADGGSTISMTTIDTPVTVKMWRATNPNNRDFRLETFGPNWTSSTLTDQGGGHFVAHVNLPAQGTTAFFMEMTYTVDGMQLTFTTQVSEVPLLAPKVVAMDAGGTYNGKPFPATATATGAAGEPVHGNLAFTYYVGSTVSGTGSSIAPTNPGTYTVVASFTSSDANYSDGMSAPLTFTIAPGSQQAGRAVPGTIADSFAAAFQTEAGSAAGSSSPSATKRTSDAPTEVANPVQTGLSAGFNGSVPDRVALGTTRDSLLPRSPVKHLGSRLADRKMLIDWAGIFETPPDQAY